MRRQTSRALLRALPAVLPFVFGIAATAAPASADESAAEYFARDQANRFAQAEPVRSGWRARHIHLMLREGVSSSGVSAPLAAKAQEISSACGSAVISGVRHTRVAGTGRMSLHASGRAVDMRGNPSCIYAHLRDWPGGYSTDYGRVQHVHISLGGGEDGLRFAHGGHRRHYAARHHHRRYASL